MSKNESDTQKRLFWKNGEMLFAEEATVSVMDHGLLYGDGVFEGIRFYDKCLFMLNEHIDRLFASAKAIMLEIVFSKGELLAAIEELVAKFKDDNGYIRIVITRGDGKLGLNPFNCKMANHIMIVDELSLHDEEKSKNGISAVITSTRRLSADGLDPKIKSLNYLNHIMAKMEALNAGADEGILLNQSGYVTEACTENIFIASKGKLFTPPISDGALEGITRNAIIDIAKGLDIQFTEKSLTAYDLYNSDECFLTGTAAEMLPVRVIDGREIKSCPGEIFSVIKSQFAEIIHLQ